MVEALQYPGAGANWTRLLRIISSPYWQMYNIIDSNVEMGKFFFKSNSLNKVTPKPIKWLGNFD